MFVELHIIQNFAPSNLNRDDTGAPKDCEFGGVRRARISSQCLKRAIRKDGGFADFLAGNDSGARTKRLVIEIAKLVSDQDPPPEEAVKKVGEVFQEAGLKLEKDHRTSVIIFMDRSAIDQMAEQFHARWQELGRGNKQAKQAATKELGEILVEAVKAPDIALFGRMVEVPTDSPFGKLNLNRDAACQVAHAISTHKVSMEFDYYTAVDDLLPKGDTGAGMIGTVEFNSACFYRYANVDLEQLKRNLLGKELDKATAKEHEEAEALARHTLEAFLLASVAAVPTGKQNSMAAQNPPSAVLAVVRQSGLWSLANAFARPVWAGQNGDLVQESIAALDEYWGKLTAMYGEDGIAGRWVCTLDGDGLKKLGDNGAKVDSLAKLVAKVMGAITFDARKGGGK